MANTIYLKYSNDNWVTETQSSFSAGKFIKRSDVNRSTTKQLSGYLASHIIDKRKDAVYNITISANELYASAKKDFLQEFLLAGAIRLSEDNVTWADVVVDGDASWSEVANTKNLPRCEFTLINKEAD